MVLQPKQKSEEFIYLSVISITLLALRMDQKANQYCIIFSSMSQQYNEDIDLAEENVEQLEEEEIIDSRCPKAESGSKFAGNPTQTPREKCRVKFLDIENQNEIDQSQSKPRTRQTARKTSEYQVKTNETKGKKQENSSPEILPSKKRPLLKEHNAISANEFGRKIKKLSKPLPQIAEDHSEQELKTKMMEDMKQRKKKEEEFKSKLTNYADLLPEDKKSNHQREQIGQIYKAIDKISETRQAQFGQTAFKKAKYTARRTVIVKLDESLGRYRKCDEFLLNQKKMMLRNTLNKASGQQLKKQKLKMLQINDVELVSAQLGSIKKIETPVSMEKLEMLVKINYGWLAIGKNKADGLFLADVNLLEENVWKVIEGMFQE